MHSLPRYLLILLCSLLLSCSDGGDALPAPVQEGCQIEQQNRFVHELMQALYLWYDQVPAAIDYDDFASPAATLDALTYKPLDRFSYVTTVDAFTSLFNDGQFTGYGFSFVRRDSDNSLWIRFVYDDSPAGRAGLQRGDQLLSINGETVSDILLSNRLDSIFGPAQAGYPLSLLIRKPDGSVTTLNIQKAVVNINTVLHQSVIPTAGQPAGYLVFNSFLQTSAAELQTVFSQFKAASIDRLVLDLRYNGGGSVPIANSLASYLHRVEDNAQLFTSLVYNDKHQSANRHFMLAPLIDALQLEQLIIITTAATCSASEMLINGLKPYLSNIKTVGATTCGKPVGMNPFPLCDSMIVPVTFSGRNSNGEGDFFDGFAPDCAASDSVSFPFGDERDPMLSEALYLADNNSCRPQAQRGAEAQLSPLLPRNSFRSVIGAY